MKQSPTITHQLGCNNFTGFSIFLFGILQNLLSYITGHLTWNTRLRTPYTNIQLRDHITYFPLTFMPLSMVRDDPTSFVILEKNTTAITLLLQTSTNIN